MLPGAAVHLMQRGNNRADCFFSDDDRRFYLFHLARLLPRARCAVHAYCLMTNHVHLLVTGHEADSCATLMKHLGQLHSQYVNKTYRRTGSLWEGRFKSCLVQSEGYLLTCYRYIEMNPVRAGLAASPGDYAWSSFHVNACGDTCDWITPHAEFVRLGRHPHERQAVYRDTFGGTDAAARFDEIRQATNAGYVVGDTSFKRTMARIVGRRVQAGCPGRPRLAAREQANGELFPRENVVCP